MCIKKEPATSGLFLLKTEIQPRIIVITAVTSIIARIPLITADKYLQKSKEIVALF
jgi:hypothetical protein